MSRAQASAARATGAPTRRKSKPSCASCYFGVRGLCALDLGGPCSTFRLDSPQGLVPPAQTVLLLDSDPASGAPVPGSPPPAERSPIEELLAA